MTKTLPNIPLAAACALALGAARLHIPAFPVIGAATPTLTYAVDGKLKFEYEGREIPFVESGCAVRLEINGEIINARYLPRDKPQTPAVSGELRCEALVVTKNGSEIGVADIYTAKGGGVVGLRRALEIQKAAPGDVSLVSFFGFAPIAGRDAVTAGEFLVPGVWYAGNFHPEANLPGNLPRPGDGCFLYRGDRITLPLVMCRDPRTGLAISIIHKGSDCQTVMADSRGERISGDYQFSSVGAVRAGGGKFFAGMAYPGTEMNRRAGSGPRAHPVETGLRHSYDIEMLFATTPNYAVAARESWEHAFNLYNPPVLPVRLAETYDGLVQTLLGYYCASTVMGGRYDAPGFPFQVNLEDFKVMGVDYQMGFVGMQIPTGYCLYREGVLKKDASVAAKGEAVLDFWAKNCLMELGCPRAWYDPGVDGRAGRFRKKSNLRTATGGMEALTSAWCFAKRHGVDKPAWIDASTRFGMWLVASQNPDGSWYLSHDPTVIEKGGHPVVIDNKFGTVCALRYLAELFIATGRAEFRAALLKAGEFCLRNIHEKYIYAACVVDNRQSLDSESGQMALNGFLALWDLTGDKKWLEAAEQAALYTETWTYMRDIPVERDHTGPLVVPADRSMVGQHLIGIAHAGADLGFAWSAFAYYRLWMETGNPRWLHVARIAAHNTKQTMNWDGTLYPGQPRGLQLEAFRVMIPRRGRGVLHCLNWNYAAHLDPMMRFQDAFGTVDLEEVEKMDPARRKHLNATYAAVQSSDWGQRKK